MESGTDLRTIQLLMGHAHLEHTMVYLHLSQRHPHVALNPLDQITVRSRAESFPALGIYIFDYTCAASDSISYPMARYPFNRFSYMRPSIGTCAST